MASDNLLPAGVRRGMYVRWALFGVIPLVIGLAACVAMTAGQQPQFSPREQARVDDIGAGLIALSALVFLGAFWFDGLWTFEPRLRRRCRAAAEGIADRQDALRKRAEVAFSRISEGALILVVAGATIPILAILQAHIARGTNIAGQLLLLGLLYQLFLLSQYPRYVEAAAFIADPRNDPPDASDAPAAQKA